MKIFKNKIRYLIHIAKYLLFKRRFNFSKKQIDDYYFLKNSGVDTELGFVTLIGLPIIQKFINSKIRIEKGVTLISDVNGNPAGISHPVILATLAEGAEIILHKDCGLSGAVICAANKIEIGEYVGLGANAHVYDTDFHALNPYHRKFDNDNKTLFKPVLIDDFAWIGTNCIILKGVHVGKGAVIGAGSIVTKDVPELNVYAGNPARFVKEIEISDNNYNILFNSTKQ